MLCSCKFNTWLTSLATGVFSLPVGEGSSRQSQAQPHTSPWVARPGKLCWEWKMGSVMGPLKSCSNSWQLSSVVSNIPRWNFFFWQAERIRIVCRGWNTSSTPIYLHIMKRRASFGRKLERHAQRARAGGRKARFCGTTGGKALTFNREELVSRGGEVRTREWLHKMYNEARGNFCFKIFHLVRAILMNFLSWLAYIPLILITN